MCKALPLKHDETALHILEVSEPPSKTEVQPLLDAIPCEFDALQVADGEFQIVAFGSIPTIHTKSENVIASVRLSTSFSC